VQCELATLAADAPSRKALVAAEARLLKKYGKEWTRLPRVKEAILRRGFIEAVRVEGVGELADEVARLAPLIDEVIVERRIDVLALERVLRWDGAPRLRALEISPLPGAIDGILRSPLIARLRRLTVRASDAAVAAEIADALAATDRLDGIEVVVVRNDLP
jgi:hypothetical protein